MLSSLLSGWAGASRNQPHRFSQVFSGWAGTSRNQFSGWAGTTRDQSEPVGTSRIGLHRFSAAGREPVGTNRNQAEPFGTSRTGFHRFSAVGREPVGTSRKQSEPFGTSRKHPRGFQRFLASQSETVVTRRAGPFGTSRVGFRFSAVGREPVGTSRSQSEPVGTIRNQSEPAA